MLLREKGKAGAEPVGMGWDEAQAALQAGTHVVAEGDAAEGDTAEDDGTGDVETDASDPASTR